MGEAMKKENSPKEKYEKISYKLKLGSEFYFTL
jgi:hypothetical protein